MPYMLSRKPGAIDSRLPQGAGAWPAPGKCNIGSTQYNTFADAANAYVNGDVIVLGMGNHIGGNITFANGVKILGPGSEFATISTSSEDTVIKLQGDSVLSGFTISCTTVAAYVFALDIGVNTKSLVTVELDDIIASATGVGTGVRAAAALLNAHVNANNVNLIASGGDDNRGLLLSHLAGDTSKWTAKNGSIDGATADIYFTTDAGEADGGGVFLEGTKLRNNTKSNHLYPTFDFGYVEGTHFVQRRLIGKNIQSFTLTVGASGDYQTINEALEYLKTIIGYYDVIIDVDEGTYTENLILSGITGKVTIRGDTRNFCGITYVDGATNCNLANINNLGGGAVSLSASGAVLTVSTAGGLPFFANAGVVVGDEVIISTVSGNTTHTITAIGIANTLTLSPSPPTAVSTTGSSVTLVPNRTLNGIVSVLPFSGEVTVEGFLTAPSAGNSMTVNPNSQLTTKNYVVKASGAFIAIFNNTGSLTMNGYTTCIAETGVNVYNLTGSIFNAESYRLHLVSGSYNLFARYGCNVKAEGSIITRGAAYGFRSDFQSAIGCFGSHAIACGIAYLAVYNASVFAYSTVANNVANTTNYSPAANATISTNGGLILFN